MKYIDLNTKTKDLLEFYKKGNNIYSLFPSLEKDLSDNDLIKFIEKHQKEEYIDLIIEKIFTQKVSKKLVKNIYNLFKDNFSILNEIVMTGNATEDMLNQLSTSQDKFLSEHSKLALLISKLNKADKSEFNKILDEYPTDKTEFNNAARYHIANHKRTPSETLKILMLDTHKHISEAAEQNFEKKTR